MSDRIIVKWHQFSKFVLIVNCLANLFQASICLVNIKLTCFVKYWFSILVSVLLFDFNKIPGMSRKSKKNTVWIHFVFKCTQITRFCLFYRLEISPVYTGQTVSSSSYRNDFSGWNLLCQAIDRVLFISYLAIILIFIASYLGGAALASQSWRLHGLIV